MPSASHKKESNNSSVFRLSPHLLTWNENTAPLLATVVRISSYRGRTGGKAHFQDKMLNKNV